MASSSPRPEFEPEPDLHPLYPTPSEVGRLLSTSSGLSPAQKATLVSHCMTRACIFADLPFLQYIIRDVNAHTFVDLNSQDEDGLVLASVIILGFGSESERDVEREECVRFLIAEGADVNIPDKAGWTPLHHASLLAPPTLISHLLTHGCSPFTTTLRNMTALDLVTAYAVVPGREDVALFLEEAMRGEGWQGSKMAIQRHILEEKHKFAEQKRQERGTIDRILDLNGQWWNDEDLSPQRDEATDDEDEDESLYTPPLDFSSMLVFSPDALPVIFDSAILNFRPNVRNTEPANALYMLARFACLTCDHTWVEELVMGATDAIEDVAFNHPDDLTYSVFWLCNCTTWLHLIRCDSAISETCELLGSFELIEEVINTVYVMIIRVAERRIDKLIDTALLEHSSLTSEVESVQFESEWSIFRSPFSSKKKPTTQSSVVNSTPASLKSGRPTSPVPSSRPSSPVPPQTPFVPNTPKGFSSLRQTFTRTRGGASTSSIQSFFADGSSSQSPQELIIFLTAIHTLLTESGVNPAIIIQLWSQIMYWTSAEMFNRILTRKRHLCRSRALQIGMNLSVLEEWIGDMGLPRGVESHFASVRELLHWLQCLSSMDEFSNLVATIQTLKHLNPLQMRRAVRDYRFEVNEPRMGEDCNQYLAQLQKDWERQRVKLGVEALRKEITDRDADGDDSFSSDVQEPNGSIEHDRSFSASSVDTSAGQNTIDILFDRGRNQSEWRPQQPPEVLGELLESRYMLPLLLPSDPRMLSAVPGRATPRNSPYLKQGGPPRAATKNGNRSLSRTRSARSALLSWVSRSKQIREVSVGILDWVDGTRSAGRWTRRSEAEAEDGTRIGNGGFSDYASSVEGEDEHDPGHTRLTRMARVASSRSRAGRASAG